jgi:hypothetical protein
MEEQQKMGERLAFYQAAVDKLTEAAKLAKGLELTEVSFLNKLRTNINFAFADHR